MKKMFLAFIIASLALAVAAIVIAQRRQRQVPPPAAVPASSGSVSPVISAPAVQPINALQSAVTLDARTDSRPDADAKRRLLERLQREEKRQQPQEGRN